MPILGILASAGAVRNSYESIQTVTVGAGGQSIISFTAIPATYKHLQIRCLAKSTGTPTQGDLTFNGDTGNNYAWHQLFGNGSSVGADSSSSRANIVGAVGLVNSTIASVFCTSIVDILDYTNTNKYKTVRHLVGQDENGSGVISLNSGLWMNTGAVTTITITARSNAFAQYSSLALYGIKG
jgi:hypothetical protein